TLTSLTMGADGRIVTSGAPRAATLPMDGLDLDAGRWRLETTGVAWDLQLPAGPTALTWPTIPAFPADVPLLAPVPAAGDQAAFLLGVHEITHEQYLAFVSDP